MTSYLFVNDLPNDGSRLQHCRSHTAWIIHQRRRQNVVEQQEQREVNSGNNGGLRTRSIRSSPPSRELATEEDDGDISQISAVTTRKSKTTISIIIQQPPSPLMLGPGAAPTAATGGLKYINFFLANAISKCALVYPAFNLSSIYSTDWVEIMVNRLFFHAGAAYLQAAFDGERAPSKETLLHRGKALEELRMHLDMVVTKGAELSPTAIIAVVMLACLEEQLGDAASHMVHRETVGQMLRAKGGLENLSYDPRYSVASEIEMIWALTSGYTVIPYKAAKRCRRRRWQVEVEMGMSPADVLPQGFRELDDEGRLSSDMVSTVVHISKSLNGKGKTERRETALRKFDYYWDAFPYLQISYTMDLTLEELLEMAILEFCSHTILPKYPGPTTHLVSRRILTKHLPIYTATHANLSQSEARAVLWMWLLTLYAWEIPSKNQQGDGAVAMKSIPFTSVKMMSEDEVENVLASFFWTEDFLAFGRRRWELVSRD